MLFRSPDSWDRLPTIFPILVRDPSGAYLDRAATQRLYTHLGTAPGSARIELGQPVPAGVKNGTPVSALCLCASARLAVRGCASAGDSRRVRELAGHVIDRIAAGSRRGSH